MILFVCLFPLFLAGASGKTMDPPIPPIALAPTLHTGAYYAVSPVIRAIVQYELQIFLCSSSNGVSIMLFWSVGCVIKPGSADTVLSTLPIR